MIKPKKIPYSLFLSEHCPVRIFRMRSERVERPAQVELALLSCAKEIGKEIKKGKVRIG